MNEMKVSILIALSLLLSACALPQSSAPVRDGSIISDKVVFSGKSTPAVLALLKESRAQLRADNSTDAVRAVERALRLEPKNPRLWHQLAIIRYREKNWQQAIAMAQKSNTLSGGNKKLQQANANLIKQAERQLRREG